MVGMGSGGGVCGRGGGNDLGGGGAGDLGTAAEALGPGDGRGDVRLDDAGEAVGQERGDGDEGGAHEEVPKGGELLGEVAAAVADGDRGVNGADQGHAAADGAG